MIEIRITGEEPLPKQSFRYSKSGGYQPNRIKSWQQLVSTKAREAMRGTPPMDGDLEVEIDFTRSNKRRVDLDNLSKAVLDAMNGIVFADDMQVVRLILHKRFAKDPGVYIIVARIGK